MSFVCTPPNFVKKALLVIVSASLFAQPPLHSGASDDLDRHIRANMDFLASDVLQGRGSGTRDELLAATYVASQFEQYGIQPVGGSYIQNAPIEKMELDGPVTLTVGVKKVEADKDFLPAFLSGKSAAGTLTKLATNEARKAKPQGIVLLTDNDMDKLQGRASAGVSLAYGGADAVLIGTSPASFELARKLGQSPRLPSGLQGEPVRGANVIVLSPEMTKELKAGDKETKIALEYKTKPAAASYTYNAVGILPGTDPKLKDEAILLSAHVDHLGVGRPVNGDAIYNGADDDASGVTAVLQMARVLGAMQGLKRTVVFATFGSEEAGGFGDRWFMSHPPVPLQNIVANLEFEMIGRSDPKVKRDQLWLSGWERTNLGPELAKHGARLVADPHPEQNFFQRSDNYPLAKRGVVAQTVSSFGLGDYYHQPSDDLAHVDFEHMKQAISSMLEPVKWLANTDWKPAWKEGMKP